MDSKTVLYLILLLLMTPALPAQSASKNRDTNMARHNIPEAKELSGMSIVGNDEAPKSLYIVPWKSSEIGVETSFNMMFNEGDVPVDREEFKRKIEYYNVSNGQ